MKALIAILIACASCSVGADGVPECITVTCEVWSSCNGLQIDEQRNFAGEPIDAYGDCAKWQIEWQDQCVAACPNAINWKGGYDTDACLLGGIAETACEGDL